MRTTEKLKKEKSPIMKIVTTLPIKKVEVKKTVPKKEEPTTIPKSNTPYMQLSVSAQVTPKSAQASLQGLSHLNSSTLVSQV